MSIESLIPSNHLILWCPLLLLPSVFHNIRIFSIELAPHTMWPKYLSFSFSISPSSEYTGLISLGLTGLISWQSKGLLKEFCFLFFITTSSFKWIYFNIFSWMLFVYIFNIFMWCHLLVIFFLLMLYLDNSVYISSKRVWVNSVTPFLSWVI